MNLLRRLPTNRLLALLAAVCALLAATVAIANAVQGEADPPPPKSLAQAIHDAIAADPVTGITARIELKNDLIDAGGFEGVSPLITGGEGRLWWTDDHRFRLELQGQSGDLQLVVKDRSFWLYDGVSNTVYRGTLPREHGHEKRSRSGRVPTIAEIERKLTKVLRRVNIAGPEPTVEAGRPAYSVKVSPERRAGLVGAAGFAWDAVTGTGLRAGIYPKGASEPVVELKATEIEYGSVDESAFAIEPPANAEVVELADGNHAKKGGKRRDGTYGIRAVQAELPFALKAPRTLAGKKLRGVRLVKTKKGAGAALVYGRGLDALLVLERPYVARAPKQEDDFGHDNENFALPTTDVGGARATVLSTPLGSAIEWSRDGVTYAIAGSVPRATVEAAARGLE